MQRFKRDAVGLTKAMAVKGYGSRHLWGVMWVMIFCLILGSLPMTAGETATMEVGKVYHGFKLIKQKKIKEINGVGKLFEHIKSGAQLLKLEVDDSNKTFAITFPTIPTSDNGLPHIMEHSVLNGSRKFPVKSPFSIMHKGSLRTFINAFTAKDRTVYPMASMNEKDFFNLMDVYMDAVLFPRIHEEPKILMQEGWHYELDKKEGELTYKGVVYGEMKGAFSAPGEELSYQINKHLYPDSPYGFSSGGYPAAIPTLTYKEFTDFHKTYYHPSNSLIFLYGDGNLEKELTFLDTNYLSKFEGKDVNATIALQKPFKERKEVTAEYAISASGSEKDQTYLTLNFLAGEAMEQDLYMALEILRDVLVNYPNAPIRQALMKAGIGKDVAANSDEGYQQNSFTIQVNNANPEDKEKFKTIVFDTLKKIVKEGLDKKVLEGAVNRMVFQRREIADNFGIPRAIMMAFTTSGGWMYGNDPFIMLEYEQFQGKLLKAVKTDYFEKVIEKYFLNNNHCLMLVLKPKKGLQGEKDKVVKETLAKRKAAFSDAQLEKIVQQTKELKTFQMTPDSPEALKTIPLLSISDINPKVKKIEMDKRDIKGIKTLAYPVFTNNILYTRFMFDASVVPQELIPYVGLLSDVMTQMNTKNYTYGEFSTQANIYTGGIRVGTSVYRKNNDHKKVLPLLVVRGSVLKDNLDKMLDLQGELIKNTVYNDSKRLKEVLTMAFSQQENNIRSNGFGVAMGRLESYFSPYGKYNDLTDGYEYYKFMSGLVKDFDKKSPEVVANLQKVASLIFNKQNLMVSVVSSEEDYAVFSQKMPRLLNFMGDKEPKTQNYAFKFDRKNEGLAAASKVQYVMQGYNFADLGYSYNGVYNVLDSVLSSDYLNEKVRVMGGAYGGFASISSNGFLFFGSYRDPNLKETVEIYKKAPEFLEKFKPSKEEMTRFIIGTIADMDTPMSPRIQGAVALSNYFQGISHEKRQKQREEILKANPEAIRKMTKMIADVINKGIICVYGNEQKIEENKTLFDHIVKAIE